MGRLRSLTEYLVALIEHTESMSPLKKRGSLSSQKPRSYFNLSNARLLIDVRVKCLQQVPEEPYAQPTFYQPADGWHHGNRARVIAILHVFTERN
jgi:hypothetical protein